MPEIDLMDDPMFGGPQKRKAGKGTRIPKTALRWSITQAGEEFDMAAETVKKMLVTSGAQAGPDHKFSTQQINAAINGDTATEKRRLLRVNTEIAELKMAESEGTLIPARAGEEFVAEYATLVREAIEYAKFLTDDQKEKLFLEMEKIPNAKYAEKLIEE